jgi:hypothetical protein
MAICCFGFSVDRCSVQDVMLVFGFEFEKATMEISF